jgi:hypothetical protein
MQVSNYILAGNMTLYRMLSDMYLKQCRRTSSCTLTISACLRPPYRLPPCATWLITSRQGKSAWMDCHVMLELSPT